VEMGPPRACGYRLNGRPYRRYRLTARPARRLSGSPSIIVLSLGSFRSDDRAHNLLSRFAYLEPNIMKVKVNGRTWHWGAVGPLSKVETARLRRTHSQVDGRDTWTLVK